MLHQTIKNLFLSREFERLRAEALAANEWFTAGSIDLAVEAILAALPAEEPQIKPNGKRVGVVCAGNIPLVGFWDTYSALVSGASVVIKPSRRDPLMKLFAALVEVVDRLPDGLEPIVAMGSDATMQALKAAYPASRLILRGSEASFALLTGEETPADLEHLADDLFTHAGLGCRSVAHLFLPNDYGLEQLTFSDRSASLPAAWADNVRYERARRAAMGLPTADKGFYLLVPHTFGTPLLPGVVGYSYYTDEVSLDIDKSKVKCYTSLNPSILPEKHTPLGTAQRPTFGQVFEKL